MKNMSDLRINGHGSANGGKYDSVNINGSGKTWNIFPINQNILEGTGTSRSNRQVIDISGVAAGKKDVQFRFVFDGDYYFWMVDDVTLVSLPDLDLAIKDVFYSPSTYAQPKSQICNDTFRFSAHVSNLGGMVQRDLKFKVTVLGVDRQTILFQDSSIVSKSPGMILNTIGKV